MIFYYAGGMDRDTIHAVTNNLLPLNNGYNCLASFFYPKEVIKVIELIKKYPEKNIKLFLDSGAHSLYTAEIIKKYDADKYTFYESKKFIAFVDSYIAFIKKYEEYIISYVNVDVIFNPEKTKKVQQYLEKNNLHPIPVIHFGSPIEEVHTLINNGYDYIGLGGLGQEVHVSNYHKWADSIWDVICSTPDKKPKIKVHGFAMTSMTLMGRYPWYSVDSAGWLKKAAYGIIQCYLNNQYREIFVSSQGNLSRLSHYVQLPKHAKNFVDEYLYELNHDGRYAFKKIANNTYLRNEINILFNQKVEKKLTENPPVFSKKQIGLFS